MTPAELYRYLASCWDKDTSWKAVGWRGSPHGQCWPTALLVQDYFGGDILVFKYDGGAKHFYNRLPNGELLDLTFGQFDDAEFLKPPRWMTGKPYIRRRTRYEKLKARVEQAILSKTGGGK